MAKKQKTVELKPKMEKISDEHLEQLQNTVNSVNSIQFNIGKVEAQKHNLLHGLIEAQEQIGVLQKKMLKEYGSFDINLQDGTINWPKEKKDEK